MKRIFARFAIALAIVLTPVIGRLAYHNFDLTYFMFSGWHFVNEQRMVYPITTPTQYGYDGQFYFKTALDLSLPREKMIVYDNPIYRKQRFLYPLLAWLFALGRPRFIPLMMIFVNCLSLLLVWKVFEKICSKNNIPWFYSLLPILYPGLHMGVARDLAEPVEALLVISLLQFGTSNPILFCVIAFFTFLTKETTMILIFPVSIVMIVHSFMEKQKNWLYYLYPLLPYGLFAVAEMFIQQNWNIFAAASNTGNFNFPFVGLYEGFQRQVDFAISYDIWRLFLSLAVVSFVYIICYIIITMPHIKTAWINQFKHHYAEIAWLCWLIFSLFFSIKIFEEDWSFVRVFSSFLMISFFILYSNQKLPHKNLVIFSTVLYLATVVHLWFY